MLVPSLSDLKKIVKAPVLHPLLLVDIGDRETLRERMRSGRWKEIMEEKLKRCDRALEEPIPQLPRSLYDDYFRTGRRHPYQSPCFYRRRMAEDLALAYIFTGKTEYLDRCRDYIWAIMEEFTWVIPAHVRLPLSPETITRVDLFSSGTAMLLADLWDLLHDDLDGETLEWMRYNILRHVLIPLRDHFYEQWWAKAYHSNWCGVCCGNSGCALILTALEEPWALELLHKILMSVERFLSTADPEGAWVEGVGYYFYGFSRVVYLADLLFKVTDGKLDILDDPIIKATSTFPVWAYLPPRSQVNFGDTGSTPGGYPDVLKRYMNRYRIPSIAWYIQRLKEENLFRGGSLRDLLWAPEVDVKPAPPEETSKWYQRIGVIITRSSWTDMDAPVLAVKAGHNAEPHNHIDVGQFIYHCYGNTFIRDLGVGVYDRAYFGPGRYENPICGAEGHNLIFVDGKSQAPGREYEGKIVDYHREADWERIKIDLTKAYPSNVLSEAIRTLLFFKYDGLVLIDEVKCAENALVETRLHFKGKIQHTPSSIDISAEKGSVHIKPEDSIKIEIGAHEGLTTRDPEAANAQYIRLLTRATGGKAKIQAYIVPYRTKEELETRLEKIKRAP